MKAYAFVVVVGIFFLDTCLCQQITYQEKYFDQYIDHFNFVSYGSKTYRQRYLVQDKWWKKGTGPIFFYTGNEGPIDGFWDASGFIFEIAPEFGALVVFAEHRFYGKSLPFDANVVFTKPYIGLLTVEQAMADYAVLIQNLKQQLGAPHVPVIAFGGSYGGMLSAFMRFKYPNVITGSIAASAPIFLMTPDIDRKFFFQDVTKDFQEVGQKCVDKVRQAFVTMNQLAATGNQGLKVLGSKFHTCHPLENLSNYQHLQGWVRNSFATLTMLDYPYPTDTFLARLPAYPVKVACDMITTPDDTVAGLAEAAGMFYNVSKVPCFDIYKDFVACADPSGCGVGPNSRAWDFQACTEIRLNEGSDNVTDMFPFLPFTAQLRKEYCMKTWGVTPRDDWGFVQFWGRNLSTASNIVFSNGDLDPWRRGGVLISDNPNIDVVLIKGGAHHLDLRAHNILDPESVIEARKLEQGRIGQWINEHNIKMSNRPHPDVMQPIIVY